MTWTRGRARTALVLLAMALAGVAAGRGVVLVLDSRAPAARAPAPEPTSTSASVPARATRGARVLHAWDADRAAAYARGDPVALRGLYAPGSLAGRRDVQVLEAYAARGLVVRGLRTQLLSLQVRSQDDRRVVLRVTDRVVGGRAVTRHGPRRAVPLPQDTPTTRVVALARSGEGWRVVSVRDG